MDCDTARLFMQFSTHHGDDLDGPEAAELHAHLEQCSACNTLAMNTRRLDQHIGRAMNAVEVPSGLKAQLLDLLAEERGKLRRRWLKRAGQIAAVAACLLLLAWGGYRLFGPNPIEINADHILQEVNLAGTPASPPDFVNSSYLNPLAPPALVELPGHPNRNKKVWKFVFTMKDWNGPKSPRIKEVPQVSMYVVPRTDIVGGEPRLPTEDASGYRLKLDVYEPADDPNVYYVLHTNDSWDWLKVKPNE